MRVTALLIAIILGTASASAAQRPAYIVIDTGQGMVLASRDAEKLWYPASVTKLMTAYVTFRALKAGKLKPTSPVVISRAAAAEPPSKMGYKVGTVLNVDNALKMMIVKSANDIAVAIAEAVGGSKAGFAAMMNAEARRLGMASTRFTNPNGLPDDNQFTTARDLAVLSRAVWTEFPEYRELFRIPAIRAGNKILRSQNTLLDQYRGANGLKTGFICASGFNMVASATRNGRTLIAVVLGAESANERAEIAAKLLNQGFAGSRGDFQLASFHANATRGAPINMRGQVCERNKKRGEDELVRAGLTAGSALEPRFTVMAPVVVYTGRADAAPKPAEKAVATATLTEEDVPVPRPRPRIGHAAGIDAATAFAPVVEPTTAAVEAPPAAAIDSVVAEPSPPAARPPAATVETQASTASAAPAGDDKPVAVKIDPGRWPTVE